LDSGCDFWGFYFILFCFILFRFAFQVGCLAVFVKFSSVLWWSIKFMLLVWILGVPFPPILRSSVRNRKAIGGAGSLCLGVLILGVAGSQGKLVPATMSRSMETNPTKRGICEEEKWVSE
jgi:hypothetical protein